MAEQYVNKGKKHPNSVVKDKYFPGIQKDCEVRVAYTLPYNIFQVFKEEKCPNKNIYIPHPYPVFEESSRMCSRI